jgi:cytochrome bd-type quinol oxidase subunit 2
MDMDRQPIHIDRWVEQQTHGSMLTIKAEMAHLTKDASGDLEEGGVLISEVCNATYKATQEENRRNEWLNSRTRGLWWVWLCLYAISGLVAICSDYSEENGMLPSASKWIQRIAAALMFGSYLSLLGIFILDQMGGYWTWTDNQSKSSGWVENSKLTDPLVEHLLKSEMAPLTKDSRGGGSVNSSDEWYNSKTRASGWVWLCIVTVSGLVAIGSAYLKEKGTHPMAAMHIELIAEVLMFGSSVCVFGIAILDQLNLPSTVKWMKP